ncbi:MAG TPA: heme-binding protein [Chloroflexota bacterium]|nr:heme-binding protein [Chloroflexota bacterium]
MKQQDAAAPKTLQDIDIGALKQTRFSALRLGSVAAAALAAGALGGTASAQSARPEVVVTKQGISLAGAQALVAAAESKARELGVPMAICIMDESGVLKAFARMDGNSLASIELVQAKAFTSAAFRTPTHILAERNAADPTRVASLPNFPNVTFLGGGYPISAGGSVVGGIGVGGGSAQQDQEVAEAALAAIL